MEKYMFHINWYPVPYYQYSLWRPYFLGFTKINFKHITRQVATLSFTRQRHMKSIRPLYCSYSNSEAFSAATNRFKKAFRIHPLYPIHLLRNEFFQCNYIDNYHTHCLEPNITTIIHLIDR